MDEPFKMSLVGKFSFSHSPMDVIRKFFFCLFGLKRTQLVLLDNRHDLINLQLEEVCSRVWVKKTWHINGITMGIFKWPITFRCSEESPTVPVLVSLPYLPVHFIHCK